MLYSIKYVPVAMTTIAPRIITQYLNNPARWRCGSAVVQQPLAFEKVIWSTKLKINKNVIKISRVFPHSSSWNYPELLCLCILNSVLSDRYVDGGCWKCVSHRFVKNN